MLRKLLITLCLLLVSTNYIHAESHIFDENDYFYALKREAEKYNVQIDINKYPDVINEKTIAKGVKNVHDIASNFTVTQLSFENQDISVASNMPVTKNRYGYFDVLAGPSLMCTIKVTLNVTTNMDNYTVLSVNSKRANQDGVAYGFISWETYSITTVENSPWKGYVYATVTGHATFGAYGVTYSKDVTSSANVKCY